MARRGRGRGQGNRGRKSGRARGSVGGGSKSKSKSKSSSRGRRGGQGNRGKGFGRAKGTVSRKSVGKGLRSVAKAAGKVASNSKAFAGVRSITSAARAAAGKVKQARADRSSKEARQNRRHDRMARQFGLDTRDMRNLKINIDVNRALNHFNVPGAITKRIPKSIRDFKFNAELGGKFRSPHKLGVREGYKAPNRGGRSIRSETPGGIGGFGGTGNWLDFYRPENQKRLRDQYTTGQPRIHPGRRGQDQFGPDSRGLPRPIRGGKPDTIAMMYENILGRKADQGGLDYWRNELQSGRQSRDDIRQNIIKSDEFQGRSEADRQAALRGVEQRQSLRRQTRRGKPPSRRGKPPRLGPAVLPSLRGKGKARFTGKKPTGRGLFPSIAAAMAARGGL